MNIKNKSNKNSTNLIIIIIISMVLFLGTYVWIHHQTLTETEKNLITHHKKLENQNKNLQEIKDKLQQNKDIIQNQITNTNKESQETTNTNLQQLNN
ncbi:ATP-dependent Zn protease, partial ['Chrysanthemum coronarium' phytoplasma]